MQNEPNFRKSQVNVTSLITVAYKNKSNWTLGENEPNTNPNKANFRIAKMNINKVLTKDYENEPLFRRGKNEPNSNPNKPNFIHHSLGEGGFKRYLAKMGHHELKYIDRLGQLTLNLFIKVNTQASSAERT